MHNIVKDTCIGKVVNKLRSEENSTVSGKAENLVAKWKKLATKEKTKLPEKPENKNATQNRHDHNQPSSSIPSSSKSLKKIEEDRAEGVSFNNNNGGFSFGDALMMPVVDDGKKKKKKKRKENDLLKVYLFTF